MCCHEGESFRPHGVTDVRGQNLLPEKYKPDTFTQYILYMIFPFCKWISSSINFWGDQNNSHRPFQGRPFFEGVCIQLVKPLSDVPALHWKCRCHVAAPVVCAGEKDTEKVRFLSTKAQQTQGVLWSSISSYWQESVSSVNIIYPVTVELPDLRQGLVKQSRQGALAKQGGVFGSQRSAYPMAERWQSQHAIQQAEPGQKAWSRAVYLKILSFLS